MLASVRKRFGETKSRLLEDSITAFPELKWTEAELEYLYIYTGELLELNQTLAERRMSTQYINLFRDAGQVIPLEVLKIVTDKNDSAVGVATVKDNQVIIERLVGAADPEALFEVMSSADAKDCKQLYCFVKSTNAIMEEDIPPFPCLFNNDTVLACVAVEGVLSAHDKPKSTHPPAFHFVNDVIVGRMLKMYKGNDSDLDALYLDVQEADCPLLQLCPDDGTMSFLFANKEQQSFSTNSDRVQEFDWGLAYGEPPTGNGKAEPEIAKPEPTPVSAKPLSGLRARAGGPTVPVASITPINAKPSENQDEDKDDPAAKRGNMILPVKNDGNGYQIPPDGEVWEAPPANLTTKNELDKWYCERLGYRPNNWKKRPWAPKMDKSGTVKLGDLKTTASIPPSAMKDTGNKHVSTPPPMLISANLVKNLKENVLPKILGANSEIITNPGKVSGDEMATPSAAAQLGKTGVEDFCYPHAARCMLIEGASVETGKVQLISRVWGDFINSYVNQKKKIEDLEIKLAKALEEAKKPEPAATSAAPISKPISGLRLRK